MEEAHKKGETEPYQKPQKQTRKSGLKLAVFALLIALAGVAGVLCYQNRILISDWFSGLSYSVTPEISALEESVNFTDSAKITLHATHPALEPRDDFNIHCDSHDSAVSILGCYVSNHIYLYNISAEGLSGVKESTLAHEFLHAVWDRLTDTEKNSLSEKLTEVYNNEEYHSLLAEDLEIYDESMRLEELHSRIGTEIANLPEELEKHYAKYFNDQDAVVAFYNSYITPFRELSEKIDELSSEMKRLDSEIDEKTKAYYAGAEQLSADIDEFNTCVNTSGCFATTSAANTKRSELLSRKASLDDEYTSINKLIEKYNALVTEYNESVLRGQTLESIINSNSSVKEIK